MSYVRSPSAINEAFMQACVKKGIPINPDYNGAQQYGISARKPPSTTASVNAARALPARQRRSQESQWCAPVATAARWCSRDCGRWASRSGAMVPSKRCAHASEVILSAGAFGSPQFVDAVRHWACSPFAGARHPWCSRMPGGGRTCRTTSPAPSFFEPPVGRPRSANCCAAPGRY